MSASERVQLGHGGGGRMSRDLIDTEILGRFRAGPLAGLPDGATLPAPAGPIVFSTDSYVVQPIEFPGGNIGHLAVHGTVNDIAACGAVPKWISLAMILEEGLPLDVLHRVLDAVRDAAQACSVEVVTGDTKVVAKGDCDGIYLNTAGVGEKIPGFELGPDRLEPGDAVIVSGPLADHGMAVLAARDNISIANGPLSDTAPVHELVGLAAPHAASVRFMRDPTRGGAASVLNETVQGADTGIEIDETAIPYSTGTRAVSELLGLDPLHVASEGRLILVGAPGACDAILSAWQAHPAGRHAARIGHVTSEAGRVVMRTVAGGRRLVDVPRGELLPRIC